MQYSLPSRSTRGQRVAELVGEAADADAAFWGVNNEIWKEDNEGRSQGHRSQRCRLTMNE